MKAVRATGSGVEVVDVDDPVGDGVTIHVRASGICGTDLHLASSRLTGDTILGHEIAGVTDDGTAVAVEPVISCGACSFCDAGDNGLCEQLAGRVIGIGLDGGMAERVVVPDRLVVAVPRGVRVDDASLIEPIAVAVRAVARVGVDADTRVAVIGGGSIGLCAVAVVRSLGAQVELVARHDHQREAGERLGASEPTDQPCDVVIEAAGTTAALTQAVDKCVPGGRVGIPATYWDQVALPGLTMGLKEVSLVPSIMYGRSTGPRDVEVAATILAANTELPTALITHRYPLEGAVDAFAAAGDRRAGAIKVVLEPGS